MERGCKGEDIEGLPSSWIQDRSAFITRVGAGKLDESGDAIRANIIVGSSGNVFAACP
jgi:hypothetical protein